MNRRRKTAIGAVTLSIVCGSIIWHAVGLSLGL